MKRLILAASLVFALMATAANAQGLSGLARVDLEASSIGDTAKGRVEIVLELSQGVPFRLFTLDAPRRLVLDFSEVDWQGVDLTDLVDSQVISSARAGVYRPGLSRLVLGLDRPMAVENAEMSVSEVTGAATLTLRLQPGSEDAFSQTAGAPNDPRWDLPPDVTIEPRERGPDAPLLVVLDPGHGGVDPGAEYGDLVEKELMLTLARELREELLRSGGFEVVLTRDSDQFVSLERRVAIAHAAKADAFISLHADSLSEGQAHGATVYILSEEASDVASALLAQRHDRNEILSGVDLSHTDDEVTDVLLDLARQETQPRTEALADALIEEMARSGGPMNRRPLRLASFSVLKAADIPSVLLEIGFLSSPRDLANLKNDEWRAKMVRAIRAGLQRWVDEDSLRRALLRQ